MRLSWNEIRVRAAAFADEWKDEGYEKGQTQLFYRDFFDVFGVPIRKVARFEEPVKNLGDKRGFIDLLSLKGSDKMEEVSNNKKVAVFVQTFFSSFRDLKYA